MDELSQNILIVDEQDSLTSKSAEQMKLWLTKEGYEVKIASSGNVALEIVFVGGADLVILVSIADKLECKRVLSEIRLDRDCERLPIILATETLGESDSAEFLQQGANDFVYAPFDQNLLLSRVANLLAAVKLQETNDDQMNSLVASAKFAVLGHMAAGIVHEIKNPLASISGFAEMIENLLLSDEPQTEIASGVAGKIRKNSDRIRRIIQSIQAYSHQGGKLEPFEIVSVKSIIEDTLVICRDRISTAEITLQIREFDPNVLIECRAIEVGEVLLNLISNAIDAMENSKKKTLEISVLENQSIVEICISNSGPEIPPEIIEKLFDTKFTSKERGKGTGLGLSISAAIVKHHKGTLTVRSDVKSTNFMMGLPHRQETRASSNKILVVEDDSSARELIFENLTKKGFDVDVASDGIEAWKMISEGKISLVLTDYKMPNLNGIELVQKIHEMEINRPRVIFMTGFLHDLSDFEEGQYWEEVFEKPINWDQFYQSVEKLSSLRASKN